MLSGLAVSVLMMAASCRAPDIVGGPLHNQRLSDGTYRGKASYWPVRVTVDVKVEDRQIGHVRIVRHFYGRGRKAEEPVLDRIIKEQSTDVDAVTGATGSSVAIMNAVEDALDKARK